MSEPQNGADLLARIRPQLREEGVEICLRPDLLEAWEEANEQLAQIKVDDAAGKRLGAGVSKEQKAKAEEVRKLEDQIVENSIMFRFRAMPKDAWRKLTDAHPPRKDNQVDHYVGYNRDDVHDAAVRKSLYDPVFTDESWAELLTVVNPNEWQALVNTVTSVNRGEVNLPKSELASRILDRRDSGSRQPAAGE